MKIVKNTLSTRSVKLEDLKKILRRRTHKYGSLSEHYRRKEELAEALAAEEQKLTEERRFERILSALIKRFEETSLADNFYNFRRNDLHPVHIREFTPEPLLAKGELTIPIIPMSQALAITCPNEKCGRAALVWGSPVYDLADRPIAAEEHFAICFHCQSVTNIQAYDLQKILPFHKPSL